MTVSYSPVLQPWNLSALQLQSCTIIACVEERDNRQVHQDAGAS